MTSPSYWTTVTYCPVCDGSIRPNESTCSRCGSESGEVEMPAWVMWLLLVPWLLVALSAGMGALAIVGVR